MSETRTGEILKIEETKKFSSGFQKRTFILKTNERYPQELPFDLIKDDCDKLDEFNMGDTVEAHFNLRGNENNGRWFVDLTCWKLKPSDGTTAEPSSSELDDDDDLY